MMAAFCLCSWVQRDPLIQPQEPVMSPAGPVEHSGPQPSAAPPEPLILNSAELGCITTRSTAMPHNQSVSPPPSPLPPPLLFLLLLPVVFWVPWDHFSTDHHDKLVYNAHVFSVTSICPTWLWLSPWGGGEWRKKGWSSLEVGLFANSHPPANSQNKASLHPRWGYPSFSLEKWKKVLTHWVINSFPMLKDSPRKPLLAWVATSCQNWWVKVNNLAFKPLFLKSANVI